MYTVFMTKFLNLISKGQVFVVLCLIITCLSSIENTNERILQTSTVPSAFDWRDETTITPVKNQLTCNAYYAFSTIAFFEQDLIINQGASKSIDLSQQFLTSCLPNGGCVGGAPKDAMELAIKKGGIPEQSNYPFKPYQIQPDNICYPSQQVKIGDRPMFGFFNLQDQQFLKQMILRQPLNIYVCSTDLKTYGPKSNSDRMLSCNKDNTYPDHTVLLIGYTETQWIIKNSWGADWGLGGFGYISRNPDNDCCIGYQVLLRGKKSTSCNIQNCQVCVQQNYCSKCKPGYFVSYKNNIHKCVQCNYDNCAECQNNVGYCKTCIYGYALYFPEQVCKISIIPNCKSIVNGGCKTCHEGYRVNSKFLCQNDCSIKNCDTCKDDKSCSQCKDGFSLTISNGSLICKENTCNKIEHCATCDKNGKCITCKGSYTLIQDSCVMKCDKPNCVQCSETQNICAKCTLGYSRDFYSHECVITSVKNCQQSYLAKYCSICQVGYQRSDSWLDCIKICNIDNCKACQAGVSNKCTVCQNGYSLKVPQGQQIGICDKNTCNFTNCLLCDTAGTTCVKCIDKYHQWSSENKSCTPYICQLQNCSKCQTDSKQCQECNKDNVLYIPTGSCMVTNITHCAGVGQGEKGLQCWNCDSGYQVDYTTWTKCKRICSDSNCVDCQDSATLCKKCTDGYFIKNISDTQNKCGKFPVYLPNCLRGNSDQTVCYQCKQFYHFNDVSQACQLNDNCPKDCVKCTSSTDPQLKCQCKSGLVWDFINSQCILNPSDSQCLVVSNFTGTPQCFECKDGFTLTKDGKGCQANCKVDYCNTCVHSETSNYPDYCQLCIEGYISTNNLTKCVPCQVQFCKTCKSATQKAICLDCKIGYDLKNNGRSCQQIPCPQNSKFNGVQCMCLSGFYKLVDKTDLLCQSCETSCKRCSSSDNCIQCNQGFYLNNKKCSACFSNCQSCSNGNTCNDCQQGYTYQMINGSNSCAEIGLGHQGYFILKSGKKARCSIGCASCAQSQNVCQQCLDGYILTNTSTCLKCSQNCKTCYPHILGACKTCQIGYVMIDAKCVRCQSNECIDCPIQADICTSCLPGFYVKNQTCHACGLGCQTCDQDGVCKQCHTGFILSYNNLCDQCLDGCSKCKLDSQQQCQQGCLAGTFLKKDSKNSSNNKCVACPEICKTCQSQKVCTDCIQGYDLTNGVCQKWCIDKNCYSCRSDSKTCTQCFAGYYLSGGSCLADTTCQGVDQKVSPQPIPQPNNTDNNTTTDNSTTPTDNNSTVNDNSTTNDNSSNTNTNNSTTNNQTKPQNNNNTTTNNSTNQTNNTTPNNNNTTNSNQTNNIDILNGSGAEDNSTTTTTTNSTTNSNQTTNTNSTTETDTNNIQTTNDTKPNTTDQTNTTKNDSSTTNDTNVTPTNVQCQICPKKYFLTTKYTCQPCKTTDQNCISCEYDKPQICNQCSESYYIDQNSTCIKCSQNCQTCRGPNFCYVCSKGYYMLQNQKQYSGSCLKCDSNCLTCVDNPKNCLSCAQGYVLSVAKICMNQDKMNFKLKLNMPFARYNKQANSIKKDFINFFNTQNQIFIIQYIKIYQGSTILDGYISIPASQKKKGDTFDTIVKNMRGGSKLGGYDLQEITLSYSGRTYSSVQTNQSESGVKGWVIAVAVVCGVVGFIILMVIICLIVKKVKQSNGDKQRQTDHQQARNGSGKNTQSHLKKENPQIRV